MVKDRWDIGDPVGKIELYDKPGARDDCANAMDFYNNNLNPM